MKIRTKLDLIKLLGTPVVSEMVRLSEEGIEVGVQCLRWTLLWDSENLGDHILGVYFCDDPLLARLENSIEVLSPRFSHTSEKAYQRTLLTGMDKPIWIDKDLLT